MFGQRESDKFQQVSSVRCILHVKKYTSWCAVPTALGDDTSPTTADES